MYNIAGERTVYIYPIYTKIVLMSKMLKKKKKILYMKKKSHNVKHISGYVEMLNMKTRNHKDLIR